VAIYNIGYCYEEGIGVPKDISEAIYWYTLAAEQGNAFAQNALGYCYEDGLGVPKDLERAVTWYQRSANQGYPWAQCNLGYCFQNGIGLVEKNPEQGSYW
jgi:TPR repeat protein